MRAAILGLVTSKRPDDIAQNLSSAMGSLSRRQGIRKLGVLTASATGVAAFVAGCGSASPDSGDNASAGARIPDQLASDPNLRHLLDQHYLGGVGVKGVGDGAANELSALAEADSQAMATNRPILLPAGVYRVAGTLTISAPVVAYPGAMLKPDEGTVLTMAGGIHAGQYQVIDMSSRGVVVPHRVDYHPAWWGAIGTDDDSATWKAMLVSASYLPASQVIIVPPGDTRLWEVDIRNAHLEGYGRTRRILPALGAAKTGNPKEGNGYIVNLAGNATVSGIDFDTDNVEGITAVFWTGSRVWMSGGRVKPFGANTVGVWAYAGEEGSITPKMDNMWVEGNSAGESGIGIRYESSDGEMTNVTVGYCSTGIEILRGSAVLTAVHIFECKENGVRGIGSDNARFVACYVEKNGQWGMDFEDSSFITVDAGTRVWTNGLSGVEFGGVRFSGSADFKSIDNKVDATFNDNVGTGLFLDGCQRTTGDMLLVSWLVKRGESPVGSTGLYITETSFDTDIRVRGPRSNQGRGSQAAVLGDVVYDEHSSE